MTNTTPTDAVILKTDALGRVRTPAARRERLLDEFEGSGMSGVQFAEYVGITFRRWRRGFSTGDADAKARSVPILRTRRAAPGNLLGSRP